MFRNESFSDFGKKVSFKVVALTLVCALLTALMMPVFGVSAVTQPVYPTSNYDFEDVEYNHTPEFPCEADSTVIVFPDPVNAKNKTLLVDSAGTAAKATYHFTDVSEEFEVSVDVYVPVLSNWQIGLFPDQFDGRIQFAVTGDNNGNLFVTSTAVSTYKAGEWFTVRIVADPQKEVADVYVNGNSIATDVKYYSSGVGYGYSGGVYLSSKDKNSELYFDNLATPVHNEVHVEKYIPDYIKAQILSSATPDQCGHDTANDLYYSAFPSVKKISDEKAIIIFHRGVKHAYSHGVLDCIVYNPTTEEVIEQKVIYDPGVAEYNAQNADLMILPNGDLYITLNVQHSNNSADPYESLVFRSTDEGETWVKEQQPTDQFGHHFSVVHDYAIVGNDVYMLAAKDPQLNNDSTLDYMCLVKSSDNCETWEYVNNLTAELKYVFNESTIEYYDGKLVFVGRGDKRVTKAALLNLDGTAHLIRNIGVDFDCIGHNGKAEIIVKDGEYYLILRNMLPDVGNAMELPLFRMDPATLSLETYVELQPKNTGTNGGDGFYAEGFFHEKNGETYFNVITYTRAYTNARDGVPSIVRFEYKWDEIKDPVFKENVKINEVDGITNDLSSMGRIDTITIDFNKASYNFSQLGGTTVRDVKGIAALTADGSTDKVYCHTTGIDGTGAVYWAGSPTQETAIIFGKSVESVANGLGAAYELQPNRKYTVTYYVNAENAGSEFGFKGLNTYVKAEVSEGCKLASHTVASADLKKWVEFTDTFTTPDAATLGDNKYLSFYVNKGSNSTVRLYLDNVTIKAEILPSESELVTFDDNGKLYYANSADLTVLPDGNNGMFGDKFVAWLDENGAIVTAIPENGTKLTAKYPIPNKLSSVEKETVELTFDKLLTYKNISGNANGVSGIISASAASLCTYSREFGGNYAIKINGKNTIPRVGLYLARDDNAYTGDQFGYIMSPNTKYTVSFDECVTPLTEGTTVTYQLMAVRSSSSAVIDSGLKLGDPINVTAKGTNYTNHTVEFTMPSIVEMGKNAKLQIVVTCTGTADTYSYSAFIDNVVITKFIENEVPDEGAVFLEVDGEKYYYNNGVLCLDTALVELDGDLYYVEEGKVSKETAVIEYQGDLYYIENGIVNQNATVGVTGDCHYVVEGTTLVLSGNGATADYTAENPAPWGTAIEKVVLTKSVTEIGNNNFSGCEALATVVYDGYYADREAITIGTGNEPLTNALWTYAIADVEEIEMLKLASIRYETDVEGKPYVSAGIRFRARVYDSYKSNATELGFVVVPTSLLDGKTIEEYVAMDDNKAVSAKVMADGMDEIVYDSGVDVNGNTYNDYQVVITGLTRQNRVANLLKTEMTVAMYAVVNGEKVYTDTVACSYQTVYDIMHGN